MTKSRGAPFPITSLPPELLAQILLSEVNRQEYTDGWYIGCWRRRIELSCVSQTWRRIALDYPDFWAGMYLDPKSHGLWKMLPRWGNLRRRVWVQIPYAEDEFTPDFWEKTVQLLVVDRLGELSLHIPENSSAHMQRISDAIIPQTSQPAPALHTLFLSAFGTHVERVPAHILTCCTGSTLRHLTLQKCAIDWARMRGGEIRNLSTLHLESLSPRPPNDLVNNLLHSSPHLQRLTIINSLPHDFVPTFQWTELHLEECHIKDDFPELSSPLLLRVLSTRPISTTTSDIRLRFGIPLPFSEAIDGPVPQATEAAQLFIRSINSAPRSQGKSISLQLHEDLTYSTTISIWASHQGLTGFFHLHSQLEGPPCVVNWSLIKTLRVPRAQILLLSDFVPDHAREEWRDFLGGHPNVEVLKLGRLEQVFDIFPVLIGDEDEDDGNEVVSKRFILPKLRKISFQSVPPIERCSSPSFSPSWSPGASPPSSPGASPSSPSPSPLTSSIITTISTTLTSRHHAGLPILKLEFLNCFSLESSFIEEVRHRVGGVMEVLDMDMGDSDWEVRDSERLVGDEYW